MFLISQSRAYYFGTLHRYLQAGKHSVSQFRNLLSHGKIWPLTLSPAVEARGFLFAGPLALELGVGLIPVRKPGKLPADTISYKYDLEYGSDTLEMHKGIVMPQSRVLVIDDVLATGGTAEACVKLLESVQAVVVGCSFLVELKDLGGRERLGDHRIETVLTY